MNSAPIISDLQFAALLGFVILAPAALTLWAVISDAREARRRRALRGGK